MVEKRKTKREIKTEQTRESIIRAGVKLFRKYGFEGTAIQDICEEAGVSVGSLYHLFPSKHAIMECVLKDVQGFYDLTQSFDYATVDPLTIIRQSADNFVKLVEDVGADTVYEALFSSPSGNKTMFYNERSNVVWTKIHLEGLQEAGRIPADVDIDHIVQLITASGIGLFYADYTMERLDSFRQDLTEVTWSLFLEATDPRKQHLRGK